MKQLTLLFFLFFLSDLCQGQQADYFDGKVIYTHLENNGYGALVPGKNVSKTEALFKDTLFRYRLMDGLLSVHSLGDIVVNTADSTRYNVNSAAHTATSLGKEPIMQGYLPKEIILVHEQDSVLGYACRKYRVIQRAFIDGVDKTSFVWAAKDLKVANLPLLAEMFGFQNTLFRQGTFEGVTLKVEVLGPDGSPELVISAVEVKRVKLEHTLFQVPQSY